jgi:dTMP kinase
MSLEATSSDPTPEGYVPGPAGELAQGFLIALEGIDGAGKSTQARWLAGHLRGLGLEVVEEHEPTGGPHGALLRRLVSEGGKRLPVEQEFQLFLLDRHDNQCRTVLPALRRGAVVILDRYYISSMAYQGARGLSPSWIREQNERIALRPDLLVIFELAPEAGHERRRSRAMASNDFEHPEEQQRVASILTGLDPTGFPRVSRIQAEGSPEEVSARLSRVVEEALAKLRLEGYGSMDRRFFEQDPECPPAQTPTAKEATHHA